MKKSLLFIAVALALSACGEDRPAPVVSPAPVVQAPAPVVVAPQPAAGTPQVVVVQQPSAAPQQNVAGQAMIGSMAGTMLGNALSRPSYEPAPVRQAPTVINKTVIVKNYAAPAPAAPVAPLPSVTPAPSKVVPAAPSPVKPSVAPKLSLAKPAATPSKSFGGFRKR